MTEEFVRFSSLIGEQMVRDFLATKALLPEATMNLIQRYEKAAQKKIDWALQRLLESQDRRQKAQPASVQVSSDQ